MAHAIDAINMESTSDGHKVALVHDKDGLKLTLPTEARMNEWAEKIKAACL